MATDETELIRLIIRAGKTGSVWRSGLVEHTRLVGCARRANKARFIGILAAADEA